MQAPLAGAPRGPGGGKPARAWLSCSPVSPGATRPGGRGGWTGPGSAAPQPPTPTWPPPRLRLWCEGQLSGRGRALPPSLPGWALWQAGEGTVAAAGSAALGGEAQVTSRPKPGPEPRGPARLADRWRPWRNTKPTPGAGQGGRPGPRPRCEHLADTPVSAPGRMAVPPPPITPARPAGWATSGRGAR